MVCILWIAVGILHIVCTCIGSWHPHYVMVIPWTHLYWSNEIWSPSIVLASNSKMDVAFFIISSSSLAACSTCRPIPLSVCNHVNWVSLLSAARHTTREEAINNKIIELTVYAKLSTVLESSELNSVVQQDDDLHHIKN